MAFQPELVVEGVEGALDPLAEAAQRPEPVRLVTAVGRTSTAPSSPICWAKARPARPLSAAMTIPWRSSPWSLASPSSSAATSRSPSLGLASPQATGMPSGAASRYSLRPQYQREWLRSQP